MGNLVQQTTDSSRLADLERRVGQMERRQPTSVAVSGPRSDLPGGVGIRVRYGVLSDGSFGVERWTSAGVRQVPTWS